MEHIEGRRYSIIEQLSRFFWIPLSYWLALYSLLSFSLCRAGNFHYLTFSKKRKHRCSLHDVKSSSSNRGESLANIIERCCCFCCWQSECLRDGRKEWGMEAWNWLLIVFDSLIIEWERVFIINALEVTKYEIFILFNRLVGLNCKCTSTSTSTCSDGKVVDRELNF